MSRGVRRGLLVVGVMLVATAVAGAALLGRWHARAARPDPSPKTDGEAAAPEDEGGAGAGFPEVDWDYWQAVNPDVVGWVTVPGTPIDLPVVQAPADDPGRYLDHDVYGDPDPYGCPYIDASCPQGIDSLNVVVLGHHMSDGSMFAAVSSYAEMDFAEGHRTVLLQTPTSKRRLAVALADVVPKDDTALLATCADRSEHLAWYRSQLARNGHAWLDADAPDAPGRTYVFCTCSYTRFNDERTLVLAVEEAACSA